MGSEAPANARIYYKDKQNELKGPFTQRQVQAMYKQKSLNSSFLFYFMQDGETPTENSKSFTLGELRTMHGVKMPFKWPEHFMRSKSDKEKGQPDIGMKDIEQGLSGLSFSSMGVFTPGKGMQFLQGMPGSFLLEELNEDIIKLFIGICNFFQFPEDKDTLPANFENLSESFSNMPKEMGDVLFKELVQAIDKKPYFFCALCERFSFTPRQLFMHVANAEHMSMAKKNSKDFDMGNTFLVKVIGQHRIVQIFKQEMELLESQKIKYESMSLENPELRPRGGWPPFKHGEKKETVGQQANTFFWYFEQNRDEANGCGGIIQKFSAEIGNAMTRCLDCQLIFANATEYYEHLLTFGHLHSTDAFNPVTLAVNVQMYGKVRERPWPWNCKAPDAKKDSAPCAAEEAAAASDDVTTNANENESRAASNGEKKQMKQRDKKREDELRKFSKWADYFAEYYIDYLDALSSADCYRIDRDEDQALACGDAVIENEEARLMCVENIITRLKKKDNLLCWLCIFPLYNYKQFFIHSLDAKHIQRENSDEFDSFLDVTDRFHSIAGNLPAQFKQEEEAFAAEIAKKYASVPLDETRLLPTSAFLADVKVRYDHLEIWYGTDTKPAIQAAINSSHRKWKYGPAAQLMAELDKHIGSKMTYCADCKVVTGTCEEFCSHLMLTSHTDMVPKETLIVTRAINVLKAHLVT